MLPARGPHPRTGRTGRSGAKWLRATAKVGSHPGPFRGKPAAARARFRPLRHATADRWEPKGSARAVAAARDGSRVLTPLRRSRRGGTSPTPLTAGMGPRDSQTDYNALRRAAARRVRPPSASGDGELRGRRLVPRHGTVWRKANIASECPRALTAGQGTRRRRCGRQKSALNHGAS